MRIVAEERTLGIPKTYILSAPIAGYVIVVLRRLYFRLTFKSAKKFAESATEDELVTFEYNRWTNAGPFNGTSFGIAQAILTSLFMFPLFMIDLIVETLRINQESIQTKSSKT